MPVENYLDFSDQRFIIPHGVENETDNLYYLNIIKDLMKDYENVDLNDPQLDHPFNSVLQWYLDKENINLFRLRIPWSQFIAGPAELFNDSIKPYRSLHFENKQTNRFFDEDPVHHDCFITVQFIAFCAFMLEYQQSNTLDFSPIFACETLYGCQTTIGSTRFLFNYILDDPDHQVDIIISTHGHSESLILSKYRKFLEPITVKEIRAMGIISSVCIMEGMNLHVYDCDDLTGMTGAKILQGSLRFLPKDIEHYEFRNIALENIKHFLLNKKVYLSDENEKIFFKHYKTNCLDKSIFTKDISAADVNIKLAKDFIYDYDYKQYSGDKINYIKHNFTRAMIYATQGIPVPESNKLFQIEYLND